MPTKFYNLDVDTTLGGNSPSDTAVSSQKAISTRIANIKLQELFNVSISNPTAGQNLTYDATNQVWKNTSTSATVAWGGITGSITDQADLSNALGGKQATLTAGDGIDITSNTISATGVKNKNTASGATNPVYDWVGTLAEYTAQAVATNHPDWVCLITDDCEATAYEAYTQSQCNNLFVQKAHEVIEFQTPTAQNNYTWYRKYRDGWVEQGGIKDVGDTNNPSTVSLPVTMADTNYFCTIQPTNPTTGAGATAYVQDVAVYNFTTTSFGINRGYNGPKRWMVCGMAA